MDRLIPDIYQKSIYDIDYKKLKEKGIKCLLFDLDNTIALVNEDAPSKRVKDLFAYLENNFKLIIISNSNKKRLTPFKEGLNVDTAASSHKPFSKKYKKIIELYGYKEYEIAAIGDQLLTDVLGANIMGITSILILPLGEHEKFGTKINRLGERLVYHKFKKKNILTRGCFYE